VNTAYGPLRVAAAEGVAMVTIDHPPTNLVDGAFVGALIQLLDAFDADDDVRAVVFSSADPDFFLMHGDVETIEALGGEKVPVKRLGGRAPLRPPSQCRPGAAMVTNNHHRGFLITSIG